MKVNRLLGHVFLFGALLVLISGCRRSQGVVASDVESTSESTSDSYSEENASNASDNFDLLDAQIKGDSLLLSVQYGGGCAEHTFELVAGPMLKSLPPKQLLDVSHDAHGDNCRALLQKKIQFDLTPYRGSPSGITVIKIGDYELTYEYH